MLSPCVTDTQRQHPAVTAHCVSTLDELTDGGAALAIGAGEVMNIKPFRLPWEDSRGRAERLSEVIQVIKLLLGSSRENPVSFSGNFYNPTESWLVSTLFRNPIHHCTLGPLAVVTLFASSENTTTGGFHG